MQIGHWSIAKDLNLTLIRIYNYRQTFITTLLGENMLSCSANAPNKSEPTEQKYKQISQVIKAYTLVGLHGCFN